MAIHARDLAGRRKAALDWQQLLSLKSVSSGPFVLVSVADSECLASDHGGPACTSERVGLSF